MCVRAGWWSGIMVGRGEDERWALLESGRVERGCWAV